MLPTPSSLAQIRPDRIDTPESEKDEIYHVNWGKYAIGSLNSTTQRIFQMKTLVNWNFYQNNQWIFEEDLEAFLTDESNDARNRIRWKRNIIQPMVQEYVGNAIRTDFTVRAVSVGDLVINRREEELSRLKFFTRAAKMAGPELQQTIKTNLPVGDTEQETDDIFDNLWQDHYVMNMNNLLKYIEQKNDFDQDKVLLAEHLALSGMAIMKGSYINSEYKWDVVNPSLFSFDPGARRKDLTDAEYMLEINFMTAADINEKYKDISLDDRSRIEQYSRRYNNSTQFMYDFLYGDITDRIAVYEVYWKDIQKQEYGFVFDKSGYLDYVRVNYEGGEYTDKDLVIPKGVDTTDLIDKGKKKAVRFVKVVRFCEFISMENVSGGSDIALKWGIMPYQETDLLNPSRSELPYKVSCWDYNNGLILAPVDIVIDNQRLINRLLSIAESRINNSRGSGTVISRSAIDAQGGEEEVQRNMNKGKPIIVDDRGRGVQNVVGNYGTSLGQDVEMLYDISDKLAMYNVSITNVSEQMAGTKGNAKPGIPDGNPPGLLGDENFFYCIGNVFEQVHQSNASRGKRIYADSPRRLSIMTGDKGAQEITITKDMNNEDFRVFIRRTGSEVQEQFMAKQELINLAQLGKIDDGEFSRWYGVATMEDIPKIIRESYKRRKSADKVAMQQQQILNQQQQQQNQQLMGQAKEERDKMLQIQLETNERDRQHDLQKIQERTMGNLMKVREQARLKYEHEKSLG